MWQCIQMVLCMYVGVCECATCGRECNCTNVLNYGQLGESSPQMAFMNEEMFFFSKNAKENNNASKQSNEWCKKYGGIANLERSAILSVENYVVFTCHWPQLEVITEKIITKGCDIFSLQKLIISDSLGLCMCVCVSVWIHVYVCLKLRGCVSSIWFINTQHQMHSFPMCLFIPNVCMI